jgi:hypothetical protein
MKISVVIWFCAGLVAMATAAGAELEADIPIELASSPSATSCPALRSTDYSVLTPTFGGTLGDQTATMRIDAVNLTISYRNGQATTLRANGDCRFTESGADGVTVEYAVSMAGIMVGRVTVNNGGSHRIVVAFPQQQHSVAELSGRWNMLGLRGDGGEPYAAAGEVTFDSTGSIVSRIDCADPARWAIDVCAPAKAEAVGAKPSAIEPDGGFIRRDGARTTRLFLYQARSGSPMLAMIGRDGNLMFGARPQSLALPAVGTTRLRWNFDVTSQLASTTMPYATMDTAISVDESKDLWVRRKKGFKLPDEHLETIFINRPRAGYSSRPAGEAPSITGAMVRFNEYTALLMLASGINVLILPRVKLFEIAVTAP